MANKLILAFLFLVSTFAVALGTPASILQLTNALIANSNTASIAAQYPSYFTAPAACSAVTTFPSTLDFLTLRICYGASVGYPFRNNSAGYEFDLVSGWNTVLANRYNSSVTVQWVSVNDASGLFAAAQAAITAGTCDIVLSTIYKRADRDVTNTASCAYARAYSGMVYKAGSLTLSATALNNASVTIAVQANSGTASQLATLLPLASKTNTSSSLASFNAVVNGNTIAAVGDGPILAYQASIASNTSCGGAQCVFVNGDNTLFSSLFGPFDVVAYGALVSGNPTTAPSTAPTSAPSSSASTVFASVFVMFAVLAALF